MTWHVEQQESARIVELTEDEKKRWEDVTVLIANNAFSQLKPKDIILCARRAPIGSQANTDQQVELQLKVIVNAVLLAARWNQALYERPVTRHGMFGKRRHTYQNEAAQIENFVNNFQQKLSHATVVDKTIFINFVQAIQNFNNKIGKSDLHKVLNSITRVGLAYIHNDGTFLSINNGEQLKQEVAQLSPKPKSANPQYQQVRANESANPQYQEARANKTANLQYQQTKANTPDALPHCKQPSVDEQLTTYRPIMP